MNLKKKTGAFLCVDCGNPIVANNAHAQRALEAGRSMKCASCMRLNRNGQRWVSYAEYLKSYEWQQKTAECKRRAGHRCQICNSPHRLESHHRLYETWGNEQQGDLLCVCRSCHAAITKHTKLYVE